MKKTTLLMIQCLWVALLANIDPQTQAMPMPAHLAGSDSLGGMLDLVGTPPEKGGAGNVASAKVESVGRWMDNPALKTGQYRNQLAGGEILRPANHNFLRHNPTAVGKVFSGDGTVDPAAKNLARVHKIQDVFNNSRPVDGWEITRQMRLEAKDALEHVKDSKALPPTLPGWVDQRGPLSQTPRMMKSATRAASATPATKAGAPLKVIGVVATVATIVVAEHEMERTEILYQRGDISARERGERHGQTIGSTALGGGGAVAGILLGAPLGPLGSIAGGIVGGAAGGAGGAKLGQATLGHSLGNMDETEETRVADASADFFQAAGPLTLPPEAYLGIGLSPATERALVAERDAKGTDSK